MSNFIEYLQIVNEYFQTMGNLTRKILKMVEDLLNQFLSKAYFMIYRKLRRKTIANQSTGRMKQSQISKKKRRGKKHEGRTFCCKNSDESTSLNF